MSIEIMKQALEALEWDADYDTSVTLQKAAITALRQAIAEAEKQEPVAWFIQYEYRHDFLWREPTSYEKNSALEVKPLYAAPQKREWVGLTDDEIWDVFVKYDSLQYAAFARAVEAKLKEKNA